MNLRIWALTALLMIGIEAWTVALVAGRIGALATVLVIVLTMVLGGVLIRKSGANLALLFRRRPLDAKSLSASAADGLAFGIAGALLMMPGFLSDGLAAMLLLPWPRKSLGRWLERHLSVIPAAGGLRPAPAGPVIEGEATEIRDAAP
jgi:UPF0716 protein FxsA